MQTGERNEQFEKILNTKLTRCAINVLIPIINFIYFRAICAEIYKSLTTNNIHYLIAQRISLFRNNGKCPDGE